jgi:hypothetical protein
MPQAMELEREPTLQSPLTVGGELHDDRLHYLKEVLKNKVIKVQEVWDSKGMSIDL